MSWCNTSDTDNTYNNYSSNSNIENSKEEHVDDFDMNDSIVDCANILLTLSESKLQQRNVNNKKTNKNVDFVYRCCQLCNKTQTPLWRRTNIYHTLCNACGIRERISSRSKNNGVIRFNDEKVDYIENN